MLFATLLISSLLAPTPYRGVVVDATTRQPVPAATVQLIEGQRGITTDAAGRFSLASATGSTVHLRVSSLGYTSAELTRPILNGTVDTIRLVAASTALPGVTVRPRQEVTLQPFAKAVKPSSGFFLIPSTEYALELPALGEGQTGTLSQIRLQFRTTKISVHQGGLRLRLLARPDTLASGPRGQDLLPAPILISAVQVAAAPEGVFLVDLSAYNLAMPAAGLFVVLEGVGITPKQQYVSITQPGKNRSPLLVTGTDLQDPRTYEVTKLEEYPQLAIAESHDPVITWTKGSNGRGWNRRKPLGNNAKAVNAMISVVVLPD